LPILLEVVLRSITAFFVLLILARLMGKTQISQLTFFDYVVGITIGSIAAITSTNVNSPIIGGLIALTLWAALALASHALVLKSIPARKLLQGEPTVVIRNGKLMEDSMARSQYNVDELMLQLRQQKVFDLSKVQQAVLETNGKLSVLLKADEAAPTRKDLQIDTSSMGGQPVVLVVGGNIAYHRLKEMKLDENWLMEQLKAQGINRVDEVVVAQLGTSGELYVDTKSDWESDQVSTL